MQHLQLDSTLQGGKYIIKNVLGQGGFGITYLAEHDLLGTKVAIKEFFMKDFCNREETTSRVSVLTESGREQVTRFREKFLKEARNIAKLRHPNIVRISDVFEENSTAYYVMDFCEGGSLSELLKLHPNGIGEPLALKYIRQVASALEQVHAMKMNHLDIKPANILLDAQGNAVLIDFGISKQYDFTTGDQTSTTPIGISPGYAPIEQYKEGGVREFSPQTDIYALGATLFKLVTGNTPPQAGDIINDGLPELPKSLSESIRYTITKAMEIRRASRFQKVEEFLSALPVDREETKAQTIIEDKKDSKNIGDDDATIILEYQKEKDNLQIENTRLKKEAQEILLKKEQECKNAVEEKQKAIERAKRAERRIETVEQERSRLVEEKVILQDRLSVAEKDAERAKKETQEVKDSSGTIKSGFILSSIFLFVAIVISISQCTDAKNKSNYTYSELQEVQRKLDDAEKSLIKYCPLTINEVLIGNFYENWEVETTPGNKIYSKNTMYLAPVLDYTCYDPKIRKIKVKFYPPNGIMSKGNSSPSDCSYEQDIDFNKGANLSFVVMSWGNKEKGSWPPGKYKIEFWNDRKCLFVKNFEIYQ